MVGIAAWGAYAPRLRLSRKAVVEANAWVAPNLRSKGKGERSMANWDEDALTMAVEAARDALGSDDDRSQIDALYFASTTAPFADRLNAGIVSAALTLEKSITASDVTGSQRCGLTALADALAACEWNKAAIAAAIKQVLLETSLKMPQLAMPVRVLVMGTPQTPSLDAILALMIRGDVVARLKV